MTPPALQLGNLSGVTLPWRARDGQPLRRDMDLLRRLLIALAEGREDIHSEEAKVKFHLGLTMGIERLHDDPVGFATQDPAYFQWLLATIQKR